MPGSTRSSSARCRPSRAGARSRGAASSARSAFFSASSTRSRLSGFSRKSKAPARVASSASAMVPCPEIMIVGRGRAVVLHHLQQVDAAAIGQLHVEHVGVGALRVGVALELGHGSAHVHRVAFAFQNHPQRAADILFIIPRSERAWMPLAQWAAAHGSLRRPVLLSPAQCRRPKAGRCGRAIDSPRPMPRFLNEMVG